MMLVSGGISPFWAGTDIATQRRVVRTKVLQYNDVNIINVNAMINAMIATQRRVVRTKSFNILMSTQ